MLALNPGSDLDLKSASARENEATINIYEAAWQLYMCRGRIRIGVANSRAAKNELSARAPVGRQRKPEGSPLREDANGLK